VEWFNAVDAKYQSSLRELNELNYARFEAKLEQRIAELRTEFRAGLGELRSEMRAGFADVDAKLAQLETRLTKRMFAFWIGQSATTAGLVLGLVKLISH